LVNTA